MSGENRRSKMTRKLLGQALMELLKKKNISQISIKEICETADVHRTTFYLHYPDQNALLDELIDEVYRNTEEYMTQVKVSGSSEYLSAFMSYVKANGEVFRTLLVDCRDHRLEERLIQLSVNNIASFTPNLPDNTESQYVRTFVVEGSFRMLVAWIKNDFDMPVEKAAALHWQLSDMIYRGIADLGVRKRS